jgi:RsiW-degrading membrane proteinase PrsW (M82 family)
MTQQNSGGWQYLPNQSGYSSAWAQPTFAVPVTRPQAEVSHLPVAAARPLQQFGGWMLTALFAGMGVLLLLLIAYFLFALGLYASIVGVMLALIPLGVVFYFVRLIDKWEPEPKRLLLFAIAWGAIASVAISLLVDLLFQVSFGGLPDVVGAVVQAPIVEELAKGLGLLLIFLIARNYIDGPVDGVVYGALIGAGFAFTENIQYFAVSLIQGGGAELTFTFIVRGIFSPFAHAMFTSVLGYCIGLAARQGARGSKLTSLLGLGVIGAIALHAFWNGSAVFGDFFLLYITMQVPLFIGMILGVIGLRREEARLTHARLSEYAAAGWFTVGEVEMLATRNGRKHGLIWAANLRGNRTSLMREFIRDATTLAAARQRIVTGRDPHAPALEQELLARTTAIRAALLSF